MKLAFDKIETLASMSGVKRVAVENFLMSMDGLTRDEARANLEQDTVVFRWNTATGRAIQQGIEMADVEPAPAWRGKCYSCKSTFTGPYYTAHCDACERVIRRYP